MSSVISTSEVRKLMPRRNPDSHKGQNGRVLIIGGSLEYFGAPILSALSALKSGVDLVYLLVPFCNFEITRTYCPDLIVRNYYGDFLNKKAIQPALSLAEHVDSIVIGPGLTANPKTISTIKEIVRLIDKPMILDACAIETLHDMDLSAKKVCITPHGGELSQFIKKPIPQTRDQKLKLLVELAKEKKMTILVKGKEDLIADHNGDYLFNSTGNAGMTVGGTGDVLSGVVGAFLAQQLSPFEAAVLASYIVGSSGDELYKTKRYFYTASDVAENLPFVLAKYV